jgi:hypothetical protein
MDPAQHVHVLIGDPRPETVVRIIMRLCRSSGLIWLFALVLAGWSSRLPGAERFPSVPALDRLRLDRDSEVLTVQFGGRTGAIGIPSWRAVIRRDDGGNISSLHVPASDRASLGSGRPSWPLTILQSKNAANITGTMDKGRENYVGFRVAIFEVVEETAERIVVRIGGPSPNRHFLHERTYTFSAAGVQIAGWLEPQMDMRSVAFDPHWDRRQIAESHHGLLPIRTQGVPSWRVMPSAGSDAAVTLPAGVDFPLEAELRLRRRQPTFVRVFYDRIFECAEGQRQFIHNIKDQPERAADGTMRLAFEKLAGITGGPVAKGARQHFKVRFLFETQEWPEPPGDARRE